MYIPPSDGGPVTMDSILLLVSLSLCCLTLANTGCPEDDQALINWTDANAWDDGQIPESGADVSITKPILLNTSPPDLGKVTIKTGGKLVWSPDVDINFRAQYILVYGEMHIGSESCPYAGKTIITLLGERGSYDIPSFNEKFIGVPENGTLELHGENRIGWTKLSQTLQKFPKEGVIFTHEDNENHVFDKLGMQIYVFDAVTGGMEDYKVFQLVHKRQSKVDQIVADMKEFLEGIDNGKVVAMAVQRNIVKLDLSDMFDAIEELMYGQVTDDSELRNIPKLGAWSMVTLKGDPDSTDEVMKPSSGKMDLIAAELILWNNQRSFKSISKITVKQGPRAQFLVIDTDYSYPILNVIDDVSAWREGDTILIASTDYDFEQTEFAQVVECTTCSVNQVKVHLIAKYTHFGEVYKNVDMRGEVALLSRNIKIQGDTTVEKQFGGHIKFLKNFKVGKIEGVELTMMGQQTDLGRYPIHFHFCEDVDQYPIQPYIRRNSIHHTFARCTTIHATHGLTLTGNVCYDTLGHGYFLEDGGEKRTVFDGNLGGGTRKGGLIPADKDPATFWITNPQTSLRNNAAIGGMGPGFWFTFPDIPLGPSKDKGYMKNKEARHTRIHEFYNNVGHSYVKAGLFLDNILNQNNTANGYNRYQPWKDPFDPKSGADEVLLDRFTGYKNKKINAWVRGGLIRMRHFSLADSLVGIKIFRENKQEQYLSESVIIDNSINIGEPSKHTPYSLPFEDLPNIEHKGVSFKNGPSEISTTWFDGFKTTDLYKAAAFGFVNSKVGHSTPVNSVTGLQFGFDDGAETGNRVYDTGNILKTMDNDHIATLRDKDGSITTFPHSQVVPNHTFYTTALCDIRSNWNMAGCPYPYGQLRTSSNKKTYMVRDDDPTSIDASLGSTSARFLVILGGSHSYIMYNEGTMPSRFRVLGLGLSRDDYVRLGLCVPRNAEIRLMGSNLPTDGRWSNWSEVDKMEDLDADTTGVKYLYDKDVGVVFFKLIDETNPGVDDHNSCTGDTCPTVSIMIESGDLDDGDCTGRAYPKYQRDPDVSETRRRLRRSVSMPAYSENPPSTWGAGPQR